MSRLSSVFLIGQFFLYASPAVAEDQEGETPSYSLDHVLGGLMHDSALSRTDFGVQVVNVHTGEEVFARQADEAFVPASVMKVLTAAVALRELGPGYTFSTYIATEGTIDADGTLNGDLYVKGFGDPTLVTEDIWRLVYDLRLAGVKRVAGDVIYDDTFFDSRRLIEGWRKEVDLANGPAYFAPLGALSVNFNTACVVVGPGAAAGDDASVILETPSDSVRVINKVTTSSRRGRPRLSIVRSQRSGGRVDFKLSGSMPLGAAPSRIYRTVVDPMSHFTSVFEGHLSDQGIEVEKHVSGESWGCAHPHGRVGRLTRHFVSMNKHSSNFVAEHILKAVGAESMVSPVAPRRGSAWSKNIWSAWVPMRASLTW